MIDVFNMGKRLHLTLMKLKRAPERVSNIKPFINKCNWNGIKYPSKIDEWKAIEKSNLTIALNTLYTKETKICPAYI